MARGSGALTLPAPGARVTIPFEADASGTPLARGTVLAEQYAEWGVHFQNGFVIGDHATDFPEYGGGNMLCTYEAGADPLSPGRCLGGQPSSAATPLIATLDFDACYAAMTDRSRIKPGLPFTNDGFVVLQGLDAGGAVVVSQQVSSQPSPISCKGAVCSYSAGASVPAVPNGTILATGQVPPPGPKFRTIVVTENNVGALDDLNIVRCAGFLARCKTEISCAAPGQTMAPSVSVDAGTVDPDGNPITFSQSPAGPFPVGVDSPVTLTANNGTTTSTCQGLVVARDCTPPTLTCPGPLTVECAGAVTDFTMPDVQATDDIPGVVTVIGAGPAQFILGTSSGQYQATDAAGNTATCPTTLTVADTTGPVITIDSANSFTNDILSPADDQLHAITLADCGVRLDDRCEGALPTNGNARITCVSSDEGESQHGRTCHDPRHHHGAARPDIVLVDDTTVELRATSDAGGDGRVYTISFEAFDASGNTSAGTCKVPVPANHRRRPPVDSGAHQTVCR